MGGEVGIAVNGVNLWSYSDSNTYESAGIWHSLAMSFEKYDMDVCYGHAADSVYHRKCVF